MLSDTDFLHVIDLTPLVALDLIIKNNRGEILLGERKNRPAKGYWFVPGGRILKNETFESAFERISSSELTSKLGWDDAALLGCFQHLYPDNYLNKENVSTHYVVLAYELEIEITSFIADLSSQHSDHKWWTVEDILSSTEVHPNTKAYFLTSQG